MHQYPNENIELSNDCICPKDLKSTSASFLLLLDQNTFPIEAESEILLFTEACLENYNSLDFPWNPYEHQWIPHRLTTLCFSVIPYLQQTKVNTKESD